MITTKYEENEETLYIKMHNSDGTVNTDIAIAFDPGWQVGTPIMLLNKSLLVWENPEWAKYRDYCLKESDEAVRDFEENQDLCSTCGGDIHRGVCHAPRL